MTTAHSVADEMGNDGVNVGNLASLCFSAGARTEVREPSFHHIGATAYIFSDGSAIVEIQGRWDVRPVGCEGFCWEGVGCDCTGCVGE